MFHYLKMLSLWSVGVIGSGAFLFWTGGPRALIAGALGAFCYRMSECNVKGLFWGDDDE